MATINPVITRVGNNILKVFWEQLTTTNTEGAAIDPVLLADFADRSVQITGTPDGATLKFQGSNDLSTFVSLTDPQGNAIEKTAAALEQVMENTLTVKPVVTGAGVSTDLDVTLIARRTRSGKEI
jgi:hypothetical protein